MKSIEELIAETIDVSAYSILPTEQEFVLFAEAYHKQKMDELEPMAWMYEILAKSGARQFHLSTRNNLNFTDLTIDVVGMTPLYTLPSKG